MNRLIRHSNHYLCIMRCTASTLSSRVNSRQLLFIHTPPNWHYPRYSGCYPEAGRRRPHLAFQHGVEHIRQALHQFLFGEIHLIQQTAAPTHGLAQRRIFHQDQELFGDHRGALLVHDKAIVSVNNVFRDRALVGRDDWQARRHSLNDHPRMALRRVVARENEDINGR